MPKKRFSAEQIVTVLRQIEVSMAQGKSAPEACRDAGISQQSFYRWRKEYGGLEIDQAKRMKDLEREKSTEAVTRRFSINAASRFAQRRSFRKAAEAAAKLTAACREMPMSGFLCNPAPGPAWTSTKMATSTARSGLQI